jgi:septum formation protein
MMQRDRIVLASASTARRAMLAQAGLAFEVEPAAVDEESLKASLRAEGETAQAAATALAQLKAERISARVPDAVVIGADQILVAPERWFDKPRDRAEAAEQLRQLRGRAHELATAAVVVRGGQRLWHAVATPKLTMRGFSDEALEAHLDAMGEAVTSTVGGYAIEGPGVGLFTKIEGDYFAILGLPLLPLLGFLRQHGAIAS